MGYQKNIKKDHRRRTSIITIWMAVGALAIMCSLITLVLGLIKLNGLTENHAQSTADLEIITAPPYYFETRTALSNSVLTPEATIPAPPPGDLAVGAYVQVTGTSGDGLRLRATPGLKGEVLLVGSEAEIFKIDDGPVDADGYTWWHLVGPFDQSRQGWAVVNYLEVVQSP